MKNIFFFPFILIIFFSCENRPKHQFVHDQLMADIDSLQNKLASFENAVNSNKGRLLIQSCFLKAHEAYKKVEFLNEYYFPSAAKTVNGPAIDEYEEEDGKTIPAEGFQVVEEYVFPTYNPSKKEELIQQIQLLGSNIKRLKTLASTTEFTDAHVFDAMRLEIFRIVTLGITGFDSPIAQNSISETKAVLSSLKKHLSFYQQNTNSQIFTIINEGQKYLNENQNFNTFNRAEFILKVANPLSKSLHEIKTALNIPTFSETRGLRTNAITLFDENAFNSVAFSSNPDIETSQKKVILGKELFNSPILSGNPNRSCGTCHQAEKGFTDNQKVSMSLDDKSPLKRNTPTILNVAYQRSFFYDSRVSYLEDQITDVVENQNEMHGSLKNAVVKIKNSTELFKKFKEIYPKKAIDQSTIREVLTSYIRDLSKYNSRFDNYMKGQNMALNSQEINGFNIFSGKGKCATCHFIPLTNGTVPPNFDKTESEVLGVPNAQNKLDSDLGKYTLTKADIHRHSFKTPTLRNIALTAPYMHNGVYKTLEEVVDFYNKGGGNGIGFSLENQTLPEEKLNLSKQEKNDLVAFMQALTDIKFEKKTLIVQNKNKF
jgi:cytochrome c peroxidase